MTMQPAADALRAAIAAAQASLATDPPAADPPADVQGDGTMTEQRQHSRGFPKIVGQTQQTQRHVETTVGNATSASRGV